MHFSCPLCLHYTAIQPFCDRAAANSKEELGILFTFSPISVSYQKKMLRARVHSILMPPNSESDIAILNRHTPNISGVGLKLTWCQPFAVQGLSKSGNPDSCTPKKAIMRCFFAQNQFSWPNGQFLPIACHIYSESSLSDG